MVLTLFYLEEQSYNEIVDMTGMSLSNVKVRLHRARHALAKVLNDLLKDEVENLY
jgi:RNA polymerase sigma-70 factor (ECF subfamily)